VDGSGTWWNHSGHLAIGSRSLMISTKNPHGWNWVFPFNVGWNVKWNRDRFCNNIVIFILKE
jgi:hypothetical protein